VTPLRPSQRRISKFFELEIFSLRVKQLREQVKAEEQINYLTKASIGYGIEKRVGKRQK